MDSSDRQKLLSAGFNIYRKDEERLVIKTLSSSEKMKSRGWRDAIKCKTKTELIIKWKDLENNPKAIRE